MAAPHLLGLPYEILELILVRCFTDLEIIVRYPRFRINTQNVQDGATLLLVCKLIYRLAKPIFFELATFGHHMTKLLRDEADPLSLVLAPAHLPMYNFKHVCFDYDYAMNFTKIEGVWPWSTMKSLKLVDYYAPTPKIVADDFLQKFRVLMKLQEICDSRGIHFTAHLPLGSKDGVRLLLVNFLSTGLGRPALHSGPHPARTILRLPEVNVVPSGAQSLVLIAMDIISTGRVDAIVRWFRHTVSFSCTFEYGSAELSELGSFSAFA